MIQKHCFTALLMEYENKIKFNGNKIIVEWILL